MAELWTVHDRLARDLLAVHGGREIDKSDGFLLLFDDPSSAVAYARAYHLAIAPLGLRARVGVHVGVVTLRENPPADVARGAKPLEVEGIAKALAARVMGVANGGQTLATAEAAPPDAPSHGHWMLKGITDPVELFEASGDGVPPADGPKAWRVHRRKEVWVPVREVRRHLPAERDAFVGRRADLLALARRLDEGARLVSVVGVGGTGKTRLVLRFGWTWLGEWPGGVWFCDLSDARSVDGIAAAVAAALDVPLGREDPVDQLGHAIAGRGACLVTLDNFEQVARHAAETVWLDRAPDARFVVTTREVLGVPGETTLALAPLDAEEAVALFVARARQARSDFAVGEALRPVLAELVDLLDRLPLAIELAASRVRLMTPRAVLDRLSERFRLLVSAGGRHTRQATLEATLDWSWDLLQPEQRAALAQLSVFERGFTLEAAEAVLAPGAAWPTDVVQALVDRSLVRAVSDDRFDLLVSVQEYAAARLGEAREATEARHGAWFARFGDDDALDALHVHGGVGRWHRLGGDVANLVAACRRAVHRQDAGLAVGLLRAAWAVLERRGPLSLALDLASAVGALPGLAPVDRGPIDAVAGWCLCLLGRLDDAHAVLAAALPGAAANPRTEVAILGHLGVVEAMLGRRGEALARFEPALALARATGDRRAERRLLLNLGLLRANRKQMDQARVLTTAALTAAREAGDRDIEGAALGVLGNQCRELGRLDEARALLSRALAVALEVGNRSNEGVVQGNLGSACHEECRVAEAQAHYLAALAIAREVGNRRSEGLVLGNLGIVARDRGVMDEARAHVEASLALAREVGNRPAETFALGTLGDLNRDAGRAREAGACFRDALALARGIGDRFWEACWLRGLAQVEEEEWERRAADAVACAADFPDVHAEALTVRAELHLEHGRPDLSRADVEAARALGRTGRMAGAVALAEARLLAAEGRRAAAGLALARAAALVGPEGYGAGSPFARRVAEVTGLLGEAAPA